MKQVRGSYKVVKGYLIFTLRVVHRKKPRKRVITAEELKELNLQRLMIRRSRRIPKGALKQSYCVRA